MLRLGYVPVQNCKSPFRYGSGFSSDDVPLSSIDYKCLEYINITPVTNYDSYILVSPSPTASHNVAFNVLDADLQVWLMLVTSVMVVSVTRTINWLVYDYNHLQNNGRPLSLCFEKFKLNVFHLIASFLGKGINSNFKGVSMKLLFSCWLIGVSFIIVQFSSYLKSNFSTDTYNRIMKLEDMEKHPQVGIALLDQPWNSDIFFEKIGMLYNKENVRTDISSLCFFGGRDKPRGFPTEEARIKALYDVDLHQEVILGKLALTIFEELFRKRMFEAYFKRNRRVPVHVSEIESQVKVMVMISRSPIFWPIVQQLKKIATICFEHKLNYYETLKLRNQQVESLIWKLSPKVTSALDMRSISGLFLLTSFLYLFALIILMIEISRNLMFYRHKYY